MIKNFKTKNIKYFTGANFELDSKTVLVEIEFDSDSKYNTSFNEKIRSFEPIEFKYIHNENNWLDNFLIDSKKSNLGHWIIALTTAFHHWSKVYISKGKVLEFKSNYIKLALQWQDRKIFETTLHFALKLLILLTNEKDYKHFIKDLFIWIENIKKTSLLPNSFNFALSASKKNIPIKIQNRIVQLGYGKNIFRMDGSFSSNTNTISVKIARSKIETALLLNQCGLPTPKKILATSLDNALNYITNLKFPLVIKPSNQDQGIGVTTNIREKKTLINAFNLANKYSPNSVIIEEFIQGDDYRILVVKEEVIAVAKRTPFEIIGDGKSSIEKLMQIENNDPRRGTSPTSLLKKFPLTKQILENLKNYNLTKDSILKEGFKLRLSSTANLSRGGTSVDASDLIHDDNKMLAIMATKIVGLDIAGIDFISTDISKSWKETNCGIIEINAQPGFRPHWIATPNKNINDIVFQKLLGKKNLKIPIAAITGTNGKTTTSMMLQHIWKTKKINTGVATTEGVWIADQQISKENLSGCPGAQMLLNNPIVESVVVEVPRKGLLLFGHPVKEYDVGALLNIQNDHIGHMGINTIDEMLNLKSTVLNRSKILVINADDVECQKIISQYENKKVILVSENFKNEFIQSHIKKGQTVLYLKKKTIMIHKKNSIETIIELKKIPATMNGLLKFNELNSLYASALAYAQGFEIKEIKNALTSFKNNVKFNPGRYNFIEGFPFKIIIDNAHNPAAIKEICKISNGIPIQGKKILVNATFGSRHSDHINEVSKDLAKSFDMFILGCNHKYVLANEDWKSENPISSMLNYSKKQLLENKIKEESILTYEDNEKAIETALKQAKKGDLVFLLIKYETALNIINKFKEK